MKNRIFALSLIAMIATAALTCWAGNVRTSNVAVMGWTCEAPTTVSNLVAASHYSTEYTLAEATGIIGDEGSGFLWYIDCTDDPVFKIEQNYQILGDEMGDFLLGETRPVVLAKWAEQQAIVEDDIEGI